MNKNHRAICKYLLGMCVFFFILANTKTLEMQEDATGWATWISSLRAGAYTAKYAGSSRIGILRIYDTRTRHILAERKFDSDGQVFNLRWKKDRVTFLIGSDEGYADDYIQLPPTYFDWVRARLP